MPVLLEPVPAITGTRPPATLTTVPMTSLSSASLMDGVSPVVPHGTSPWMPCPIWNSTRFSSASTSTSPFRNGVTSAVNAPLNISLLQLEVPVQDPHGLLHPVRGQHARYLYLRGRDHPDGDARPAQGGEHPGRVARTVQHPRADHGDLAEVTLPLDHAAQGVRDPGREFSGLLEVAAGDGERHVGGPVLHAALDYDVHGDAPLGQGGEDPTHGAGASPDAVQGDAGDVQVVDDAGQGLACLQTFQLFSSRDYRAWDVLKGGPYVHLDAVERAELYGARVHDLGPAPGHAGPPL